ncbi:MAG: response regulator transcription factor [Eubacterium sp.]|nr:response regulator transcription factor [Eubacterium sp.]
MIRIGICDDERYMSDRIRAMVSRFFHPQNIEIIILQFSSGEELLKFNKKIDILFLDIQMKGIDGMETARKLRRRKFKGFLIFITVLKEMVFQSFEVQPYDYLVKPIEEQHFQKLMERLLGSMRNARENLLIQKGYESRIIPIGDIIFCEIIDRKIYLHLVSSEVVDYYDRIENLEKKLNDGFFRCHRSYLIHLKYLKSYKNGTAYMENGREIPVSRLRSKEFSNVILQYMKCEGNH